MTLIDRKVGLLAHVKSNLPSRWAHNRLNWVAFPQLKGVITEEKPAISQPRPAFPRSAEPSQVSTHTWVWGLPELQIHDRCSAGVLTRSDIAQGNAHKSALQNPQYPALGSMPPHCAPCVPMMDSPNVEEKWPRGTACSSGLHTCTHTTLFVSTVPWLSPQTSVPGSPLSTVEVRPSRMPKAEQKARKARKGEMP